jgi:hypothetical protein
MKKKKYIKPTTQVYHIKTPQILCGSPYGSPDPNNPYDFG